MGNKKTLVLGASTRPHRYAYRAVSMLVDKGHSVVAIGHDVGAVAGVEIQNEHVSLENENIDTVTLYLNPRNQREYYDYIIEAKPRRVIFNPGTENPELYQLLRNNHIEIDIACTLILLAINQY